MSFVMTPETLPSPDNIPLVKNNDYLDIMKGGFTLYEAKEGGVTCGVEVAPTRDLEAETVTTAQLTTDNSGSWSFSSTSVCQDIKENISSETESKLSGLFLPEVRGVEDLAAQELSSPVYIRRVIEPRQTCRFFNQYISSESFGSESDEVAERSSSWSSMVFVGLVESDQAVLTSVPEEEEQCQVRETYGDSENSFVTQDETVSEEQDVFHTIDLSPQASTEPRQIVPDLPRPATFPIYGFSDSFFVDSSHSVSTSLSFPPSVRLINGQKVAAIARSPLSLTKNRFEPCSPASYTSTCNEEVDELLLATHEGALAVSRSASGDVSNGVHEALSDPGSRLSIQESEIALQLKQETERRQDGDCAPSTDVSGDEHFLRDEGLRAIHVLTKGGSDISLLFPTFSFETNTTCESDDGLLAEIGALQTVELDITRELEQADIVIKGVLANKQAVRYKKPVVEDDSISAILAGQNFDDRAVVRRVRFATTNQEYFFETMVKEDPDDETFGEFMSSRLKKVYCAVLDLAEEVGCGATSCTTSGRISRLRPVANQE